MLLYWSLDNSNRELKVRQTLNLEGKVAIVTGGANGIGKATALKLAQDGASVVVADIDIEGANKVVNQIKQSGRQALALKVDVTKSEDTDQMAKTVLAQFGQIDILANIAGGGPRDRRAPFHKSSEEVWDFIVCFNLKGVRNSTRAVIEHMVARKSGKIINIGSTAGTMGSTTKAMADYAAAKAAVIGFSKSLAKEMAQYGINVNSITPGPIATEDFLNRNPKEVVEKLASTIHLGRMGKPEEVASLVAYLASEEADFFIGSNIVIDGGVSLGF